MPCASICRRPRRCLKPLPQPRARRSSTRSSAPLYPKCENISVDYAVLEPRSAKGEHLSHLYCIPAEFSWNDLGSWASLYEYQLETRLRGDAEGNVADSGGTSGHRGQRQLHLQPQKVCRVGRRGEPGGRGYRRCAADRPSRPLAGRGQNRERVEHHRPRRADLTLPNEANAGFRPDQANWDFGPTRVERSCSAALGH